MAATTTQDFREEKPKMIPKGRPKSGRVWKSEKKRYLLGWYERLPQWGATISVFPFKVRESTTPPLVELWRILIPTSNSVFDDLCFIKNTFFTNLSQHMFGFSWYMRFEPAESDIQGLFTWGELVQLARLAHGHFIDVVTVFDASLPSRQTHEKLQCLYENLMLNNFRRTAVLKKIWIVNWSFTPKDSTEKNWERYMCKKT